MFFAVSFFLLVFVSGCFQSPAPPQPAPPEITSISPDRGCAGRTVTITGKNFGEAQGESRVTFAPCGDHPRVEAEVLSWSDTVIEVKVPCGACSGDVVVTVNGLDSNGVAFTVCVCLPPPELVSGPTDLVYNTTQKKYYTTIQEAIDEAEEGDEIVVSPGTYHENIDFNGKNITLRSTDPDHPERTVIEGSGEGPVVTFVAESEKKLRDTLPSAALQGFTIQNASGNNGVGVYLEGVSLIIEQNIITKNEDGGIYVEDGYAEISGNTITENTGSGIAVTNGASAYIHDNTITGNTGGDGGGIYVSGSGTTENPVRISNNTITGNTAGLGGGGIFVGGGSDAEISGNTITGNTAESGQNNGGGGILVFGSNSHAYISGNTIKNNQASSGPGGGIAVTGGATATCCGNIIENNTPDDVSGVTCDTGCAS